MRRGYSNRAGKTEYLRKTRNEWGLHVQTDRLMGGNPRKAGARQDLNRDAPGLTS